MRRTRSALAVAAALVESPGERHWGYNLSRRTGVRSGVLYPMLTRMLGEGWLIDGWEDPAEIEGRPPRRYYTVTPNGHQALAELLRPALERSARQGSDHDC